MTRGYQLIAALSGAIWLTACGAPMEGAAPEPSMEEPVMVEDAGDTPPGDPAPPPALEPVRTPEPAPPVEIDGNFGAPVEIVIGEASEEPAPSAEDVANSDEYLGDLADIEPAAGEPDDGPVAMSGRAALRAPGLMVENEPYFLESVIGVYDEVTDQQILDAQLSGALSQADPNGEQQIDLVELGLSSVMKVTMTGSAFDIEPTAPEEQYVARNMITRWTWAVTPKRTGRLPLTVTFSADVEGPDGKTYTQVMNTISRIIEVKSLDTLFEVGTRGVDEPTDEAVAENAETTPETPVLEPELPELDTSTVSVVAAGEVPFPTEACISPFTEDSTGKLALIIVNQEYPASVGALNNVYQDGVIVKDALEKVGFSVDVCADLGRANFRRTMSAFNKKVAAAAAAGDNPDVFFYYSGHGAALAGDLAGNYLIPTDLEDLEPFQISADAIRLDAVMGGLTASGAETIFVVSDACRNVIQAKGATKGFAPVGFRLRSQFMFGYATDWGDVALDNGHYARALAKAIIEVDGPAELVFNQVQQDVAAATNDAQRPRYEDGLTRGYRFTPAP